jgi:aldehyde dehydrogenase (NAD+)
MEVQEVIAELRNGFSNNKNYSCTQRRLHLDLLDVCLEECEQALFEALSKDFNKPEFESFLTEIFPVTDEIRFARKRLKRWMRPQKVRTAIQLFPASSRIYHEPKGTVLIIGAWNYPVNLVLAPLVAALAAGNTVLIKPSELAPATSAALKKCLETYFSPDVVQVLEGDGPFTSALLDHKFDHVFYTGSTHVGRLIYEKAAKHLSPVTLELGGKSPAIFHTSANLFKGVKRLLWGKFLNGGQTCVAPDYVLVPVSLKADFLKACAACLEQFFKEGAAVQNHIINEKHFRRLLHLLQGEQIVHFGGENRAEDLWIAPTIVEISDTSHPLMQEEIFGPVLPVLFYSDEADIKIIIAENPDPLALYVFSGNRDFTAKTLRENPSGGAVVNDVVLHLSNGHLPFGGRGTSGFGSYHGFHGFQTFSHSKSVLRQVNWLDPSFRYAPYTTKKFKFLRKLTSFLKAF